MVVQCRHYYYYCYASVSVCNHIDEGLNWFISPILTVRLFVQSSVLLLVSQETNFGVFIFAFQTARQVCCCYSFLYGTHSMFFAEIFRFFPSSSDWMLHHFNQCRVHISINDQRSFLQFIFFFTQFCFHIIFISLRSIFLSKPEWKRNNNFRRKIAHCVFSSINPDGLTQCPNASTDISTGTDATNNGTATTQYSNDIANGNHQESCLWPNAMQVILTLFQLFYYFQFNILFSAIFFFILLLFFFRFVILFCSVSLLNC